MEISRREAVAAAIGGAGLAALPAGSAWGRIVDKAAKDPLSLRVCGLENPLALGDLRPRFSWKAPEQQRAYRITVASDAKSLRAQENLLWDSGHIEAGHMLDIAYGGPATGGRAYWQVEIWPQSGPSVRSAIATWEDGLDRWSAEWLACETEIARRDRLAGLSWVAGREMPKRDASRYFHAAIDIPEGPAELLLSANEVVGVWVNGAQIRAVQDDPVQWTTMAVYPLSIPAGKMTIAVEVKRRSGFGLAPPVLAAFIRHGAQLAERRALGAESWRAAIAAPPEWTGRDFDASAWDAAVAAPSGSLPVGEPWPAYAASWLRRAFTLDRPIRRARLYATALGAYEPWINGRRIGNARMTPEFTDPSKRILYQAYDLTDDLVPGENMIGFWVGDGTYGSKFSTSGRFAFGPAPCRLLAQLEIEFADGTTTTVGTGAGWQIADSPVRESSIYDGEIYDARIESSDWAAPHAAADGWRGAEPIAGSGVPVDPQRCAPIKAHERLEPASVRRLGNGDLVADFGQNFAGWPVLTLTAPRGTRVEMRFAESLRADGAVDQANLRTARARDIYIASGAGRETWEPRFTYHGFRYVQLNGVPEGARWSLSARAGYQDLTLTGEFRVGDAKIRKFWENSLWSQKSNFWGLPTDCPQRDERLGWIGDAQIFWEAASFNMDTAAYTGRVMEDMRRGQKANGAFPDCIPPFVPGFDLSSPGWADGGIILPHVAWRQYGSTGIIDANWDAMDRYMSWILAANPDHIWAKGRGADYGDWLAVDSSAINPGLATTPKDLVGTAFWAANALMMASMANATGRGEDAARYDAIFRSIRTAFNKAFVKPDGSIGNASQTSYILPIRFGLLDAATAAEAGTRLVADIERRGGHLSTGFLGTPHILDALAMTGHEATAVSLLLQREYPSWGYMVEKGATSIWERWNSDTADGGMNSLNHYAFGAIGGFLFRRIAGIAPAAPGFSKVRIEPIMDPRLRSGGATYESASGRIRTDWRADGSNFRLDVELAPGIEGEVVLPGGATMPAKPGRNRFGGPLAPSGLAKPVPA